ncbi:TPA: hypothetical protein ACH3X1_004118 [Trebouxia sp. C0004]
MRETWPSAPQQSDYQIPQGLATQALSATAPPRSSLSLPALGQGVISLTHTVSQGKQYTSDGCLQLCQKLYPDGKIAKPKLLPKRRQNDCICVANVGTFFRRFEVLTGS